ncbi:hypothetical protein TSTA_107590 [Talaromyces stipitatus ATCC 10500]|uniref:Uncharacterized protein n=1 Tax=Talaromyces stipitatus (strain ATCC 10500 / CBS 375.48 / QM 6759 / NRRL 1006) TaxID=441959 RepID=B8MNA3_TALSN|nr:uncharacterized protein TSTA_107590 [Talaromyces stipitatus ATCC 10500]EED14552.1 hypothetical protein TSTA_107590 [Talaromyces stipitatus ATCC 10500]
MSFSMKRDVQREVPRTSSGTFAVPGPVSRERLEEHVKRASDSLAVAVSKRRKKHKKKSAKSVSESPGLASEGSSDHGSNSDAVSPSKSRLEVPVLKTKAGTIRPLGDVRSVPCYECIRSITNDSFIKYPHRCYDVKHETRIGVNSQCSTCARKHVSPCLPIPAEFAKDSDAIYAAFELEGHTDSVRGSALALLERMPAEPAGKKNRVIKSESEPIASPSPSFELSRVSEADYDSVLHFRRGVKDLAVPNDLRLSIRKIVSDWIR